MEPCNLLLLCLRNALHPGEQAEIPVFSNECFNELYRVAEKQNVLPLIIRAISRHPSFLALPDAVRNQAIHKSRILQVQQIQRHIALESVINKLEIEELHPVVMKGASCRSVYPAPDERISNDEDILIPLDEFSIAGTLLEELGYHSPDSADDDFEKTYASHELCIELHSAPFNPESNALRRFNLPFENLLSVSMRTENEYFSGSTLNEQTHLLLLLLHAFKHFVHSGMGIRQVCDCIMWAEKYGEMIDYSSLFTFLRSVSAEKFALCIFKIGHVYLGFDTLKAHFPSDYLSREIPYQEVLEDFLSGSVFGADSLSRAHSATITLNAYEGHEQGKRSSLIRSLFPTAKTMQHRYPYLKDSPEKLPIAWLDRLFSYLKETNQTESDAAAAVMIGNRRNKLLKQLGITD